MMQAQWMMVEYHRTQGQAAIDGVEHLANEMNRKWGVGRLRLVVSQLLREKFDSQVQRLQTAVEISTIEDVKAECARMLLAWRVLDQAAEDAGIKTLQPEIWEVMLPDRTVAVLVKNNMDAAHVIADGRHKNVYTLDEIANLIAGFPDLVKAKQIFPGATVTRVTPKFREDFKGERIIIE